MYKKANEKIESTQVERLIGFPPYNTKPLYHTKYRHKEQNIHIRMRLKGHSSLSLADSTKAMRTTS